MPQAGYFTYHNTNCADLKLTDYIYDLAMQKICQAGNQHHLFNAKKKQVYTYLNPGWVVQVKTQHCTLKF